MTSNPWENPDDVQTDPHGFKQHDAGAKMDNGKIMPRLIVCHMPRALQKVAEVATYGAQKYTVRAWEAVPMAEDRYTDALLRHMLAQSTGEINDPESGLPHSAHIAWNALALLELQSRRTHA